MRRADNLRYKIRTASVTEKLIGINVAVFVVFFLFKTLAFLLGYSSDFELQWFVFPADPR